METPPPKISVLLSVRNGLPYLKQTVTSILGQSFRDFEFVIVDNCSTDGSREYLQEISTLAQRRVQLILNERDLGHSGGLNRGLEKCRGEWIARIDADDVALPNRLERQLAFVEANPDVAVTCCLAFYINEHGERKGKTHLSLTTREKFRELMEHGEAIGLTHPCVFMRRDVVVQIGAFREEFGGANDIDLWNRISERGHLILVQPEYLMEYRIHSGAISSSKFLESRLKYEWVRACMAARRSGKPEPSWNEFLQRWNSAGFFARLNRKRKAFAKMYYRLGGENFIGERKFKGGFYFAFSMLLQPQYALRRLFGQVLVNSSKTASNRALLRVPQLPVFASAPVTVIIACRNGAPFIRQALESCFNQTRSPEEVIVVDDASTDGSSAILDEFARAGRIRLLRNTTNLGRDLSFDRALEFVNTKYVAILDADDLALPNRLERQVAFMETHPDVGVSGSFVQYINARDERIARGVLDLLTEKDFERYVHSDEPFGLYCPAVILRAEVFKNPAFRFRKEFWPASDIDLWNRIAESGWKVLAQPEFLTAYRVHGTSAVTTGARNTRLQFEWARACMRARRQGKPEPTREQFLAERTNAPWLTRLNRWRKTEAKIAYRAAGFAFGERQQLRTLRCLAKAFCLQPLYVAHRLLMQIFE
jgi:glycosyltransferase involved in cell wall biosynthesis